VLPQLVPMGNMSLAIERLLDEPLVLSLQHRCHLEQSLVFSIKRVCRHKDVLSVAP